MNIKEAYQQKIEAQLDECKTEIDKMKVKLDKADADVKFELYRRIQNLVSKQAEAQLRLNKLKEADEGTWEDLKAGVELAWESLGEAVKSAKSSFK